MVDKVDNISDEKQAVLTKIELGSCYTAKINVDVEQKTEDPNVPSVLNYEFLVHIPTTEDDWNIAIKSKNLMKDLIGDPGLDLNILATVYATLDAVVDKITVGKQGGEKVEIKEKFWDWVKKKRNSSKWFSEIVRPVFTKFKEFEAELNITEDELKN